jgi:hypothetical protein
VPDVHDKTNAVNAAPSNISGLYSDMASVPTKIMSDTNAPSRIITGMSDMVSEGAWLLSELSFVYLFMTNQLAKLQNYSKMRIIWLKNRLSHFLCI